MESSQHFYQRRALQEHAAARIAVTAAARERRLELARTFEAKLRSLEA